MDVRDQFLTRLKGSMDGKDVTPWSGPSVTHRDAFLENMVALTKRVSTQELISTEEVEEETATAPLDQVRLEALMAAEDYQQAFFMARRLVANGEDWAEEILREIQQKM